MGQCSMGGKQEMRGLSRDEMLSWKRKLKPVQPPDSDGVVYIRSMSGIERSKYLQELSQYSKEYDETKDPGVMLPSAISAIVMCCCDSEGKQMFTDDDRDAIAEWPGSLIDMLSLEAIRLNGIDQDSAEQVEKN